MKVTNISPILVYLNSDPKQGPKHTQAISLQINGKFIDGYIQRWRITKLGQM